MKKAVLLLTFFTFLTFFNFAKGQIDHPNFIDDYTEFWITCDFSAHKLKETYAHCGYRSSFTCNPGASFDSPGSVKASAADWAICEVKKEGTETTQLPNDTFYLYVTRSSGWAGGCSFNVYFNGSNVNGGDSTRITHIYEYAGKWVLPMFHWNCHTGDYGDWVSNSKIVLLDTYGMPFFYKGIKNYSIVKRQDFETFSKAGLTFSSSCNWDFPLESDGTWVYLNSYTNESGCINSITMSPGKTLNKWSFGLQFISLTDKDTYEIIAYETDGDFYMYKIFDNQNKIQLIRYNHTLDVFEILVTYTVGVNFNSNKWNAISISYDGDKLRLFWVVSNTFKKIESDVDIELVNSFAFIHWNDTGISKISINDIGINELYVTPPAVCGNGICESGETTINCPQDCPGYCGDGICNSYYENSTTCPEDCGTLTYCGNGICEPEYNETYWNCPQDCPPPTQVSNCFDIYSPGEYKLTSVLTPNETTSYCIRIFTAVSYTHLTLPTTERV